MHEFIPEQIKQAGGVPQHWQKVTVWVIPKQGEVVYETYPADYWYRLAPWGQYWRLEGGRQGVVEPAVVLSDLPALSGADRVLLGAVLVILTREQTEPWFLTTCTPAEWRRLARRWERQAQQPPAWFMEGRENDRRI